MASRAAPEPTAGAIAGALADAHRRSVFAAVQLGAEHIDAVVAATGLSTAQVGKALGKLVGTPSSSTAGCSPSPRRTPSAW